MEMEKIKKSLMLLKPISFLLVPYNLAVIYFV